MTNCNAKIITAGITDQTVTWFNDVLTWSDNGESVSELEEGEAVLRQGNRLVKLYLNELGCIDHPDGDPSHDEDSRHENEYVQWYDNAPGAVPHTNDVTVTDAEVRAALDGYSLSDTRAHTFPTAERMRAALLAAKRAAKEQT